jgi:protein gp37
MAESKIEWTDRSDWNPIRGCTRVSPGCGGPGPHGGCYAEAMAARFSDPAIPATPDHPATPAQWGHGYAERTSKGGRWTGRVELIEDRLLLPLRWKRPAKVFPSSTSDIWHESLTDDEIDRIMAVMALTPHLTYQPLTKRAVRMRDYLTRPGVEVRIGLTALGICMGDLQRNPKSSIGRGVTIKGSDINPGALVKWPLPNVWLGVSVEDQIRADERIPALLATPATIRWISAEPLLGPIDLESSLGGTRWIGGQRGCAGSAERSGAMHHGSGAPDCPRHLHHHHDDRCRRGLDWAVVGGESGPRARDNDFETNARAIRDQCLRAGVAFFGKQNVRKAPLPEDLLIRQFPLEQAA